MNAGNSNRNTFLPLRIGFFEVGNLRTNRLIRPAGMRPQRKTHVTAKRRRQLRRWTLRLAFFGTAFAALTLAALLAVFSANTRPAGAVPAYVSRHIVIIDPGHGGIDGGAVGYNGVVEKNINLAIGIKLREFFRAAGYTVIMTREDDRSIHDDDADTVREKKTTDLHNRMAIMQQNPDAVFISIHQNKYEDSRYSGTQVFYSPNDDESKELASDIQTGVHSMLQPDNSREIKPGGKNLYLLYQAKSPAVIVECGFLSNPTEAGLLQTDQYQNKMAFAVFCATLKFYAHFGTN